MAKSQHAFIKRIGILSMILLFSFGALDAQRVGVVFSGGGAKGLYHIGILKALEENRIPIDYISGTSMGAIVAGLYAIGYTPDEMAQLFLSDQVKLWMTGRIEREYTYYFNRMQPRQDMLTLNLDLKAEKNIAIFPTSLVPSIQIDMSFNELFSPATAFSGGDFDRLFVPFRCVASDVYNRREVVYREGDVGKAIRASMTIPMVFRPLKADSLLLYDGGIFNNFPWQPLEEDFRPDFFIGGKCIKGRQNPDETNLIEQIEAITMTHTDFVMPEGRSILIERVFDDVGVLDFSRTQYVMDLGYTDAMAMIDSIKRSIPRRQDPEALHNKRLTFRSQLPELMFDDYRVEGISRDQSHYMRRMLGLGDDKREVFNFQEFKSDYFKILSEGEIIGDYPEMAYNDSTGYFTVYLPLRFKPSFRVKLGGNISSTSLQQAYIGLEYRTIARRSHSIRFDGNFSALYTSLRAGWRTDFYLMGPLFMELTASDDNYNFRKGPNWSSFERFGYHKLRDTHASAALGFPWGRSSAVQARFSLASNRFYYYEREYPQLELGSSDRTSFDFYGLQLEASTRTLNYALFPTRGLSQSISGIFVNGTERFRPGENYPRDPLLDDQGEPVLDGEGNPLLIDNPFPEKQTRRWMGVKYSREKYFQLTSWFSLGYLTEAVFTTIPDFYTLHASNFVLPGFAPTPYSQALYMDKFRSPIYAAVGIIPTIEFSDSFYLQQSFYLFAGENQFEKGLRVGGEDKIRRIFNASLVYQSPLGPASLTVANFSEPSRKWFVVFNFGFTLFNRRGLFY